MCHGYLPADSPTPITPPWMIRYPETYQEEFIRDIFFAANVFPDIPSPSPAQAAAVSPTPSPGTPSTTATAAPAAASPPAVPRTAVRSPRSLEEEQLINETAACRTIGVTLETRPDYITRTELRKMRRCGCTRIQIGIRHTDRGVLEAINRGNATTDTRSRWTIPTSMLPLQRPGRNASSRRRSGSR
eukprot:GHVU01185537.1.p1 GENE.GHVU01185537.1~~GHVU01185537.1.p1  ORF type:complete len:187 (+),score=19.35 GHVU01185537.1:1246-1806(+)